MEPKETVFFIVNFDHISHIILVSPLLTLNKKKPTDHLRLWQQFSGKYTDFNEL